MDSNPYLEARREWDERYADLVLGKRNWQIVAGQSLTPKPDSRERTVWLGALTADAFLTQSSSIISATR